MSKQILIAEDDHLLLKVLRARFIEAGYSVVTARNGEEALSQISPETCTVLLDLIMPVKNGFEVLKELQNLNNKVPIIVFTNLPKDSSKDEVFALGAKEFYEKEDVDIEDLVGIVSKYCA